MRKQVLAQEVAVVASVVNNTGVTRQRSTRGAEGFS